MDDLPSKTDNLYERIGTHFDATPDEIRTAYRKSAIYWHPDRNNDPRSHLEFIAISEAYEILSDPFTRFKYDSTLTNPERKEKIDMSEFFSSWNPSDDLEKNLKRYMEKFSKMDFENMYHMDSDIFMDVIGMMSIFSSFGKRRRSEPEAPKPKYLDDEKE